MANKRIHELTSDIGVDVVGNDLIAVDKYVSPGVYTTVFKNSDNVRNYISTYVTGLSTASFTNIETSIDAVQPAIYSEQRLHNVVNAQHSITSGSSLFLKAPGLIQFPFAGRAFVAHVKIFAYSNSSDTVAIGEYRVVVKTTGPSILSQAIIYEDEESSINLNDGVTFTTGTDGSGIYIQCSNTHSLGAETVTINMNVHVYGYNLGS